MVVVTTVLVGLTVPLIFKAILTSPSKDKFLRAGSAGCDDVSRASCVNSWEPPCDPWGCGSGEQGEKRVSGGVG